MDFTLFDFVLAGVLLTILATAIGLAVTRSGNRVVAIGAATLGVLAIPVGFADDAPGLVLFGLLLLASAFAMRRRATAVGQ
jgi:MYXO-CTERM domain-containing protein